MATSFRTPFQVLKRDIGEWVNGVYRLNPDAGTFISVMATVQVPKEGDYARIEATAYGRRAGRYIKIYTDTRLSCVGQEIGSARQASAGDIFFYDGSRYLLFGEADFTMLKRTRSNSVSHWRYYACETIEYALAEVVP